MNSGEMTLDGHAKSSCSVASVSNADAFSEADYSANPAKVIAHAAATGRAVVVAADGRPRVIISIPVVDLPTLDD
jgi:hypothetical protein